MPRPGIRNPAGVPDSIVVATGDDDYEAFARLIREYWQWLRSSYSDAIDAIGAHQGLDQELTALSTVYGPLGAGLCSPCATVSRSGASPTATWATARAR
jgi:hypothetical protein